MDRRGSPSGGMADRPCPGNHRAAAAGQRKVDESGPETSGARQHQPVGENDCTISSDGGSRRQAVSSLVRESVALKRRVTSNRTNSRHATNGAILSYQGATMPMRSGPGEAAGRNERLDPVTTVHTSDRSMPN